MAKALTIFGMVVAGLLILVFSADWGLGVPFEAADWKMNFGAILAGLILAYVSWDAFKESR